MEVDCLIIGGGLAGAAVAWQLHERGWSFVLCDDPQPSTASRIAAGLVTPITGKRCQPTAAFDSAYPLADAFYRRIEAYTGGRFWWVSGSVRLFPADQNGAIERRHDDWNASLAGTSIAAHYVEPEWIDPAFRFHRGGLGMPQAARLETLEYLDATQTYFQRLGNWHNLRVDLKRLSLGGSGVEYRGDDGFEVRARWTIDCTGASANVWSDLPLRPVQGDILEIELARPIEATTVHCGWWLAATHADRSSFPGTACATREDRWLLGSTYQWRPLDGLPSLSGRQQLLERLSNHLPLMARVLDHRAAIRPASYDQRPLVGIDPERRLGCLNGLGAKGCLLAPWNASRLVDGIFENRPLPLESRWPR